MPPVEYKIEYGKSRTNVIAHHNGRNVGLLSLEKQEANYCAGVVQVLPEHQRKGIATALYDFAVESGLRPIVPSVNMSPAGKSLWKAHQKAKGDKRGIQDFLHWEW